MLPRHRCGARSRTRGDGILRHLPSHDGDVGLFVTFAAVPDTFEHALALEALRRAVGGGLESLLYAELSQRLGLAYAVDTTLVSFSDVHLFENVAFVQPDRIIEVLCRVLAILATVRREGVDEELLDIIQAQYRVEFLSRYNDASWLAAWAASHAGCDEPQFDVASYETIMNGFTPDALRDAAQRLMVASNTLICAAGALDEAEAWKLGWYGAAAWASEFKRSASPQAERAAGGAGGG